MEEIAFRLKEGVEGVQGAKPRRNAEKRETSRRKPRGHRSGGLYFLEFAADEAKRARPDGFPAAGQTGAR